MMSENQLCPDAHERPLNKAEIGSQVSRAGCTVTTYEAL